MGRRRRRRKMKSKKKGPAARHLAAIRGGTSVLVYRDGEIGYRTIQGLPPILGTVLLVSENARQEFDFLQNTPQKPARKIPVCPWLSWALTPAFGCLGSDIAVHDPDPCPTTRLLPKPWPQPQPRINTPPYLGRDAARAVEAPACVGWRCGTVGDGGGRRWGDGDRDGGGKGGRRGCGVSCDGRYVILGTFKPCPPPPLRHCPARNRKGAWLDLVYHLHSNHLPSPFI